ncbi:GDSL-type esterase/lipase family protein [Enterobacter asburiae]|uniref:GDSL-type esterase/lipase family protein n=1 Tax=Enterobacter asburiae TaxID=61645 RepID=UPI00192B52CA|nr:GDSL-type esterase/lipase family protein [Enterobacter asburiae]MBL5911244.1 hypothetical protein [Enterobacter asburiae]
MPMSNQTFSVAASGTEKLRPLAEWMSQVRQMQKYPTMTGPVPVMSSPPIATLTKGTGASGVTITAGGTGYTVGDTLTVSGGVYAAQTKLRITTVGTGGAVTAAAVIQPGVYTTTPVNPAAVSGGTGSGATFTLTWNAGVASSMGGTTWSRTNPAFRFLGYAPKDVVAGYRGNMSWGTDQQANIEFVSDAPLLDFRLVGYNSQYDLYVDGQRISAQSIKTDSSGAPYIYTIDWSGVVKPRTYRLSGINTTFGGVIIQSNYGIWYPAGSRRPLVWQLGDSYTFGIGATQASFNDFRVMCDSLGLDGIADGIGGSGWTSTGSTQPQQRIQNKLTSITYRPDLIILSLGYNDAPGGNISLLQTNWRESVALIRQLCPAARVIQIGPATPLGSTTQISAVRSALISLCAESGIPFVDVDNWVNANNKNLYTQGDNVHPTDPGHWFRGSRLACAISEITGFGIATPYRDTPDGFQLDIFNWSGSQAVANAAFLNFLSLAGITQQAGGTAGVTVAAGVAKLPAKTKPSGVTFSVRITGTVGGASGTAREWKIQTRRADGTTVVGSTDASKTTGTDISNRDAVLESHTSGASDLFTTQGVIIGLQNDSGATITLTSVSVRIYRQVNAE